MIGLWHSSFSSLRDLRFLKLLAMSDLDGVEKLPQSKVELTCRLGYMDLEQYCKDNNFCYYIIWYCGAFKELSCQINLGGRAYGPYGEKIMESRIKYKAGSGLVGKAFEGKEAVLLENAQAAKADASDAEKQAAEFAKECGVASSWAIFRDGAVFEFGTIAPMTELPHELIDKIGGSTGVAAAAKAVLAAVRLSAMAKSSAAKRAAS